MPELARIEVCLCIIQVTLAFSCKQIWPVYLCHTTEASPDPSTGTHPWVGMPFPPGKVQGVFKVDGLVIDAGDSSCALVGFFRPISTRGSMLRASRLHKDRYSWRSGRPAASKVDRSNQSTKWFRSPLTR